MSERAAAERVAAELLANMHASDYAECVPLLADALFEYGKDKRRDGALAVLGALSGGQAERLRSILRTSAEQSVVQDPPTEHTDPARLPCGCERAYGCSCYTRD